MADIVLEIGMRVMRSGRLSNHRNRFTRNREEVDTGDKEREGEGKSAVGKTCGEESGVDGGESGEAWYDEVG